MSATPSAGTSTGSELAKTGGTPAQGTFTEPAPLPDAAIEPLDEIDWKTWDGKLESIPEARRKDYEPVYSHFTKKYADYDKVKSQHERLQRNYDLLMETAGEDPRVTEMTGEIEKLKADLQNATEKYTSYESQVKAAAEAESKTYADNLAKTYPKYFTDAAEKAKAMTLFNEGWEDPEVVFKVLDLGPGALEIAREAKAEGASDALAFKFASLRASSAPAKPQRTPAAQVMADGAGTPQPLTMPKKSLAAMSHAEARAAVAKKYATGQK